MESQISTSAAPPKITPMMARIQIFLIRILPLYQAMFKPLPVEAAA
jgi:hypothetical protein